MNALFVFFSLFIVIILLLLAQNVLYNSKNETSYVYIHVYQSMKNVDKVNFLYCLNSQLYETRFFVHMNIKIAFLKLIKTIKHT